MDSPSEMVAATMTKSFTPRQDESAPASSDVGKRLSALKECYSEAEAAAYLDISVERLHFLLDQHIFNDGTPRPDDITFSQADLVVLGFWIKSQQNPKILRMPRR